MAFSSPSDFAGKKVAVIDKVFFSEKIIEQYGSSAIVVKVHDATEGLHLVNSGQVDYFLGASINAYLISKYQLFDLTTQHVFYGHPVNNVIATRSDWPELSSILDKGLSSISKEEIFAIAARWRYLSGKQKQQVSIQLSAKEKAWLKAHPVVRLAGAEIPPLDFYNEKTGQSEGLGPDYLNSIGDILGIEFQSTSGNWQDILAMAQHKKIDGIRLLVKNNKRVEYLGFTDPYSTVEYGLVTKKSSSYLSLSHHVHRRCGLCGEWCAECGPTSYGRPGLRADRYHYRYRRRYDPGSL